MALQKAFPEIRIFDRHVGLFNTLNGAPIMINKPGMADLWATLPFKYGALHIEIEVKTGTGRLSKNQKNWKNFCEKQNIIFIEARNELETVNEIKEKLNPLRKKGLIN